MTNFSFIGLFITKEAELLQGELKLIPLNKKTKQIPDVETTQCEFRRHLVSLRGLQGGL